MKDQVEFSLSVTTPVEQWVSVKGRANGQTAKSKRLNAFLDDCELKIREIHKPFMLQNIPITARELSDRFKGIEPVTASVLDLYREHNDKLQQLINHTVAHGTWERHTTSAKLFGEFLKLKYNVDDMPIKDVTVSVIDEYRHFLLSVRKVANNTMIKYIRNLGKIFNDAKLKGVIQTNPIAMLKFKMEDVNKEFLTMAEVKRLIDKEFSVERLGLVRDIFVFCCFTGLAYVDVAGLSKEHITQDNNGRDWIQLSRNKTGTFCSIPLLEPSKAIIEKYFDKMKNSSKVLPVLSNQKMNSYLKEIADVCGIEKNLTFHLARHTFATTTTLAKGVPIETVSKMLGHTNIQTTQIYARITNDKISRDMQALSGKLQSIEDIYAQAK